MDPTLIPRSIVSPVSLQLDVADQAGGAPRKVTEDDRKELLRALRAGEPMTLQVLATVFLQHKSELPLAKKYRSRCNANFARFVDDELPVFAKSFEGRLFLRDHNRYSMADVGGRILESELVAREGGELLQFRQRLELVKPWAIEDALDGTMQTFSIGWEPKRGGFDGLRESLLCSVCNESLFECSHFPGDEVTTDHLPGPVIVEALWTNVRGSETSEVAFPAVRGTEVRDIRAALSEARRSVRIGPPASTEVSTPDEELSMKTIAIQLGLTANASEDEIVGAAAKLAERTREAEARLDEERKARAAADEDLVRVKGELATLQTAAREGAIKRLHERALADGLIVAGSKREDYFLAVAARDIKEAESYLGTLDKVVPTEMQTRNADRRERSADRLLTESQRKINAQLGISDEVFLKHAAAGAFDEPTTEEEEE